MRTALLPALLLLSGCGIYLDPLYERYLAEGLQGLDNGIQDLDVPHVGEGALAAGGKTQVMVWDRDAAGQHWLVDPYPEPGDGIVPQFVSMPQFNKVGVLYQKGEFNRSYLEVRTFDVTGHQQEGLFPWTESIAKGFETMDNNLFFYLAEVAGSENRLAEYSRLDEQETTFELRRKVDLTQQPEAFAACPQNHWLAVSVMVDQKRLRIYDFAPGPGDPVELVTNSNLGNIDALAFSRDCSYLAIHPKQAEFVFVYETSTLDDQSSKTLTMPGANHGTAMAFSPDGSLLAVAATWDFSELEHPSQTRIYDWRQGELVFEVEEDQHLKALAFEPDGRRLAAGGPSGIVKLWDVERILQDR